MHCVLNYSPEDLSLLCCLQISTCHQLLHPQVLQLLVKLFETEHSQLDVMEQVILRGFGGFFVTSHQSLLATFALTAGLI